MPEKVESGASVHLSHDPPGAGVDAFGVAVVLGKVSVGTDFEPDLVTEVVSEVPSVADLHRVG